MKELSQRSETCGISGPAYYEGGSKQARYLADLERFFDMAAQGRPTIGFLLFLFIRIFGAPIWPHKRRWGNRLPYWQSITYRQQKNFIRGNRLPRGQEKFLLRKYGLLPARLSENPDRGRNG